MARQIFVARRFGQDPRSNADFGFYAQVCKAVRREGNKESYIVSFNALQMRPDTSARLLFLLSIHVRYLCFGWANNFQESEGEKPWRLVQFLRQKQMSSPRP